MGVRSRFEFCKNLVDNIVGLISDLSLIIVEYALGNASASYEDLEQSAEGWLAECFNDAEMNFNPDDLYASLDL